MPECVVVINPIATPLQIGLYRQGKLIDIQCHEGQTSDVLVAVIGKIMQQHTVDKIVYASGPGSHMGIKLTYIALKTIELIRNIPFCGCSAFLLNGGKPLKAMGNLYFVKEKETIITQRFDEHVMQEFGFPGNLSVLKCEAENTPRYLLPAV